MDTLVIDTQTPTTLKMSKIVSLAIGKPKKQPSKIACKCGGTYFDTREDKENHLLTREHITKMEKLHHKSG